MHSAYSTKQNKTIEDFILNELDLKKENNIEYAWIKAFTWFFYLNVTKCQSLTKVILIKPDDLNLGEMHWSNKK